MNFIKNMFRCQQAVQIMKPCQRAHQRGQEQVNTVCLNNQCKIRLACINCQRDGYHKDHLSDLCHFDYLLLHLEKDIADYHNAGIFEKIEQKKQQFNDAKADILKTLDQVEAEFMKLIQEITEVDLIVRESIKMVETNDFLLFMEIQAQVLMKLKGNQKAENLKKLMEISLISELLNQNQSLRNKVQLFKINEFLKKYCENDIQFKWFEENRVNYDSNMPKEMKLIVEEGYPSELKEANSLFLGGFLNNLKHGKGILVKNDRQEIFEGVWEKDSLKWGKKIGKNSSKQNFIYVGFFKDGKAEGKGILRISNGDIYEGVFENGKSTERGKLNLRQSQWAIVHSNKNMKISGLQGKIQEVKDLK